MGTPFIQLLRPSDLGEYDRYKPPAEQPGNVPKTFLDAMEVREQVFVIEQNVPLQNEFDSDDARSCHWVYLALLNVNVVLRLTETRSCMPLSTPRPNPK
jgi:hypothetical protein